MVSENIFHQRRVHILVHGEVQRVGFRATLTKKARELGLTGFVQNLPGERVEIIAEGEFDKIEQILLFCRKGPPTAVVTEVMVQEEKPKNEFSDFCIAKQ